MGYYVRQLKEKKKIPQWKIQFVSYKRKDQREGNQAKMDYHGVTPTILQANLRTQIRKQMQIQFVKLQKVTAFRIGIEPTAFIISPTHKLLKLRSNFKVFEC